MMEMWRPFSANETSYGLIMLAVYIAAAVSCSVAANKCRDHPRHRRGGVRIGMLRREYRLWQGMAALLAMLAIYRQIDLAELVTGLGRNIAVDGKWYGQRRPFQLIMLCIIAIAGVCGAAAVFKSVAGVNRLALTALAACAVLVLLLGINALSLHSVDSFFHRGYRKVNVYNVIESGSLATILAGALCHRQQATAVRRR